MHRCQVRVSGTRYLMLAYMWHINLSVITQLPLRLHMAVTLSFHIIVQGAIVASRYLSQNNKSSQSLFN